ncbi:MAG: hypothetical protein E7335_07735 [Clostridiales bacterium]|nr:hypothetical protein [Clostridiales bacterium]
MSFLGLYRVKYPNKRKRDYTRNLQEACVKIIPRISIEYIAYGYLRGGGNVHIPWELILAFGVGLALLWVISYLLLIPMRFLWRLMTGSVLGAIALLVINLLGRIVGYSLTLNPFTAMAVGFLGLPGVGLILVLQLVL